MGSRSTSQRVGVLTFMSGIADSSMIDFPTSRSLSPSYRNGEVGSVSDPREAAALPVSESRVKMPPFTQLAAERCESGRIGVPGEHVNWQRFRGFESHPLRHTLRK